MKKAFYKRKRLWITLILLVTFSTPFLINPLNSFRKTVTFGLNLLGVHERTLRVGNYRLHYFEGGENNPKTVILLHGFGGNAMLTWMQLLPALKKNYHVIAPDLLASNFLRLNPKTYSIDQEVALVLAMMETMGINQANFVGLSVGGWIGLILALEHPEKVD